MSGKKSDNQEDLDLMRKSIDELKDDVKLLKRFILKAKVSQNEIIDKKKLDEIEGRMSGVK